MKADKKTINIVVVGFDKDKAKILASIDSKVNEIILVKVGDRDYPADEAGIKDICDLLAECVKGEEKAFLVTHHAVTTESIMLD